MAGRASLSFLGQEDISLSGDPQVTYFVERYAGQTQFSQRVDQVIFDGQSVSFGSENHRILPKNGDLITNMYMLVQFPSIVPNVSVLDSVGTLMFQYVELYIGSELVERLYGEYIEMTYDLTVPKGKQPGLAFLTGKTLQYQNVPLSSYYVPLPFSLFNKGLPLCAIKDDVTFRIVWNPSTFFTVPPTQYTGTFTATLSIEYTYISEAEIKFMRGTGSAGPGSTPPPEFSNKFKGTSFSFPRAFPTSSVPSIFTIPSRKCSSCFNKTRRAGTIIATRRRTRRRRAR